MGIRQGTERDLTHPDCVAAKAQVERGEADKGEVVKGRATVVFITGRRNRQVLHWWDSRAVHHNTQLA